MRTNIDFFLAFDTDWVPQFVLDAVLEQLVANGVRATFFCTSAYNFAATQGCEVALHPNFLPGSTHGDTPQACLAYLKMLYPQAKGSRSHALYWHGGLRKPLLDVGIRYEASTFCPLQPYLQPWFYNSLWRLPVWWSDGLHVINRLSLDSFSPPNQQEPGLKICVFHPIHIYLNSRDLSETRAALAAVRLPETTEAELAPWRRGGKGIAQVFEGFLRMLRYTNSAPLCALLPKESPSLTQKISDRGEIYD